MNAESGLLCMNLHSDARLRTVLSQSLQLFCQVNECGNNVTVWIYEIIDWGDRQVYI